MLIRFLEPDFEYADERGRLVQVVHDGWKQVNVIESRVGQIRGNHYHKDNREAFYIIKGRLRLILEESGMKEVYDLMTGQMFQIEPYVIHTFEFMEESILLGFYSAGVEKQNGEKDIFNLAMKKIL